jgi:hypothetical protein
MPHKCQEKVDLERLKIIASNFDDICEKNKIVFRDDNFEPLEMKAAKTKFFNFYKEHIVNEGTTTVQYNTAKHLKNGRLYAKNSLQSLPRKLRHTLAQNIYTDIDIVNCHPNLSARLMKSFNIDCTTLTTYNQKREEFLSLIMKRQGITREEAKTLIISICYGCGIDPDWCGELVDFYNDMRKLINKAHQYFPEEFKMATKLGKENNKASALSYKCQSLEREILEQMIRYCKKHKKTIGVLCHDGLMIEKGDTDFEIFIEKMGKEIGMKLSIKKMDEAIDLSGYTIKPFEIPSDEQEIKEEVIIIDKKSLLPNKVKIFRTDVYREKKVEWETTFCKILSPIRYVKTEYDGKLTYYTTRELNEAYCNEYLKMGKAYLPFLYYWLADPNIRTYDRIQFHPEPDCPPNIYNTYEGLYCDNLDETDYDPEVGQMGLSKFLELVRNNANDNEEIYQYIIKWVARKIQYPHLRNETAVFFKGLNGTGKTMLLKYIASMFGKYGTVMDDIRKLSSDFNEIVKNLLFLGWDDPKDDKDQTTKGLNSILTASTTQLNCKWMPLETIKVYFDMMGTLNKQKLFSFDGGERRYMIIRTSTRKSAFNIKQGEYWEEMVRYLSDTNTCVSTMIAVRNYLKSIGVSDFNPQRHKIITDDFISEKERQIDSVLAFLREKIEDGVYHLMSDEQKKDIWQHYKEWYSDSYPDTKYMKKKMSFYQELMTYAMPQKEYENNGNKFTNETFCMFSKKDNREYFRFDSSALTNYLYYHQIIKQTIEDGNEKIKSSAKQPPKPKSITELDKKIYPRCSSLVVMKYWDKTYGEVYDLDKDNPHHEKSFQKYVALKDASACA